MESNCRIAITQRQEGSLYLIKIETVDNYFIFQIVVDRTSWITQPNDKTSIIYQLDARLNVPLYVYDSIFFSFYIN